MSTKGPRPLTREERQSTPHICRTCNARPGAYVGILVFDGEEVPACPTRVHFKGDPDRTVQLEAVSETPRASSSGLAIGSGAFRS